MPPPLDLEDWQAVSPSGRDRTQPKETRDLDWIGSCDPRPAGRRLIAFYCERRRAQRPLRLSVSGRRTTWRQGAEIQDRIGEMDRGKGVVVLTDMFGGPVEPGVSLLDQGNIEVITRVNLPLLIKLIACRETQSMAEATLRAR